MITSVWIDHGTLLELAIPLRRMLQSNDETVGQKFQLSSLVS